MLPPIDFESAVVVGRQFTRLVVQVKLAVRWATAIVFRVAVAMNCVIETDKVVDRDTGEFIDASSDIGRE